MIPPFTLPEGIPIKVSEDMPKTWTRVLKSEDYDFIEVTTELLGRMVDGTFYMHPDRYELLKDLIA